MTALHDLTARWDVSGRLFASGLPGGLDAAILPDMVAKAGNRGVIHICLDDQTLALLAEQLAFFAPKLNVLRFPAWDCLPYDRVSPSTDIIAQRLATLAQFPIFCSPAFWCNASTTQPMKWQHATPELSL